MNDNKWTYAAHGGEDYPVKNGQTWKGGEHVIVNTSFLDRWDLLEKQMKIPLKLMYVDPPWGQALVSGYHTKAGKGRKDGIEPPTFEETIKKLLSIAAKFKLPMWMEGGMREDEITRQWITEAGGTVLARQDITYYGPKNPCNLIIATWGQTFDPPDLTGMDDAHTPGAVLKWALGSGLLKPGDAVTDPCTGLGITLQAAIDNNLVFYGTELSPWRTSAAVSRLAKAGLNPKALI